MNLSKETLRTLLLALFVLNINSCSIVLPSLVGIDNMANKNGKKLSDFNQLKNGTNVKIELSDSSTYSGIFREQKVLKGKTEIFIENKNGKIKSFKANRIIKTQYYSSGGSLLEALIIGAAIDAVTIIISVFSKHNIAIHTF